MFSDIYKTKVKVYESCLYNVYSISFSQLAYLSEHHDDYTRPLGKKKVFFVKVKLKR